MPLYNITSPRGDKEFLVLSPTSPQVPTLFQVQVELTDSIPIYVLPQDYSEFYAEMLEDLQDVFDSVAAHLLQQGAKAEARGFCYYRTSKSIAGGYSCAVGCLIPDALYDPDLEGSGVRNMVEVDPDKYRFLNSHLHPLQLLQHIHDGHEVNDWGRELHAFAVNRNLKTDLLPKEGITT